MAPTIDTGIGSKNATPQQVAGGVSPFRQGLRDSARSGELFSDILLPIAGIAETIATKGKSPGTVASAQRSMLEGFRADRENRALSLKKQDEADRQNAMKRKSLDQKQVDADQKRKDDLQRRAQTGLIDFGALGKAITGREFSPDEITAVEDLSLALGPEGTDDIIRALAGKRLTDKLTPEEKLVEFGKKERLKREIEKIFEVSESEEGLRPLTVAGVNVLGDFIQSVDQVSELQKVLERPETPTGPLAWLRGKNILDVEAQGIKQMVATTKQVVGKALEGGVLRKEDEAKYAKILPKESDTLPVANRKVSQIMGMLNTAYKSKIKAFKLGGFDVSRFPSDVFVNPELGGADVQGEVEKVGEKPPTFEELQKDLKQKEKGSQEGTSGIVGTPEWELLNMAQKGDQNGIIFQNELINDAKLGNQKAIDLLDAFGIDF